MYFRTRKYDLGPTGQMHQGSQKDTVYLLCILGVIICAFTLFVTSPYMKWYGSIIILAVSSYLLKFIFTHMSTEAVLLESVSSVMFYFGFKLTADIVNIDFLYLKTTTIIAMLLYVHIFYRTLTDITIEGSEHHEPIDNELNRINNNHLLKEMNGVKKHNIAQAIHSHSSSNKPRLLHRHDRKTFRR